MNDEPKTVTGLFSEKEQRALKSFLVVDCGRANVKAALFDTVMGRYALVARASASSTHGPPWFDVQVGVRQALAQITAITGRTLLNDTGQVLRPARTDGSGVDWFGLLLSGAEALESVPVGLLEQTSLATARRALATVYVREVDGYGLSDNRGPWKRVSDLAAKAPDVILVAGGTEGGAEQRVMGLVEEVALACEIMEEQARPVVIYAGNGAIRDEIVRRLNDLTDTRTITNVRWSGEDEFLIEAKEMLGSLYVEAKGAQLPGFLDLRQWADARPEPVAHAFAAICRVLAADLDGPVVGLDIGAGSVTWTGANAQEVSLEIRTDLGLGRPLEGGSFQDGHFEPDGERLGELRLAKQVHSGTVPLNVQDSAEERQLIAALAAAVDSKKRGHHRSPLKGLVLRGQFVGPRVDDHQLVTTVLGGLSVFGLFQVLLDRWDILPALGLLAETAPRLTAQVLAGNAVPRFGWVAAIQADGLGDGQPAAKIELSGDDGLQVKHEVETGEIVHIDTPIGQRLDLIVEPVGRADAGAGLGRSLKATIEGTWFGLLVDARRSGRRKAGR